MRGEERANLASRIAVYVYFFTCNILVETARWMKCPELAGNGNIGCLGSIYLFLNCLIKMVLIPSNHN